MITRRNALPNGAVVEHNDGRRGTITGRKFSPRMGLLKAYHVWFGAYDGIATVTHDEIKRRVG